MNPDDELEFFKRVCKEIEIEQEDERIKKLKRKSQKNRLPDIAYRISQNRYRY